MESKKSIPRKAKGEFVGESDTREGAARKFAAIRKDYEERFPLRQRYQERPADQLAQPVA